MWNFKSSIHHGRFIPQWGSCYPAPETTLEPARYQNMTPRRPKTRNRRPHKARSGHIDVLEYPADINGHIFTHGQCPKLTTLHSEYANRQNTNRIQLPSGSQRLSAHFRRIYKRFNSLLQNTRPVLVDWWSPTRHQYGFSASQTSQFRARFLPANIQGILPTVSSLNGGAKST